MKASIATGGVIALIVCSWLAPAVSGQAAGGSVNIWLTTPSQARLLAPQSPVSFAADSGSNPLTIDIDPSTSYQQMDGFGASFTDSSAWLVATALSPTARAQLLTQLFDPANGIGLSYLRQPMGATDFALADYTYDDMTTGTDPTLSRFSIAYDQQWIIPVLNQALQINPNIRVIATPWSPPAWMKTNGSLHGGSLKTDPQTMAALANYFVQFVQQYGKAGVKIDRVTPQNEPLNTSSSYPTMYMDAATETNFIANYLAPAFTSAGLSTGIVAYDHNWDDTTYPESVLGGAARQFVVGSAWHCYGGTPDAMSTVHDAYPTKDIFFTECSAGAWSTSFSSNLKWDMENLIIGGARNWARTVTKWNIALDTNYGPQNGGCTNCTGLVTIDDTVTPATYRLNFDYYTLGHISKFVRPGAYRIASNTFGSGSVEDVAFRNPDGSQVLIVLNADRKANTFKVREAGQSFSYTLGAGAVATFTWAPSTTPPPVNQPPVVSMASPADGSTFMAPATIGLAATASDDVGVAKVEYYSGSTLIGTSSSATNNYAVNWRVTTAGTYTITAVATDNAGLPGTSAPVTVNVKRKK